MSNHAPAVHAHRTDRNDPGARHASKNRDVKPKAGVTDTRAIAVTELALTLICFPVALGGLCGLAACGLGWAHASDFVQIWTATTGCLVPLLGCIQRRLMPFFLRR